MPSTKERELPKQCCETVQRCPQFLFDPLLEEAVVRKGMTEIRYGVECVGCQQNSEGVTCFTRNVNAGKKESIVARFIVGCDGPTSAIRNALVISFEGKDLGYTIGVIVCIHKLENITLWALVSATFP
jgi:2-polyprenyl-6-methoxyphenol hydroxylase-like FAD-dependent oxidoreductase